MKLLHSVAGYIAQRVLVATTKSDPVGKSTEEQSKRSKGTFTTAEV
jgi:hypothetical protein